MTLVSPPIHLASQRMVTLLASLGGLKMKWQDPRCLVWQYGAVAAHDHPWNCQSSGSRSLVSTFSQVGSVPTSMKESIGGNKWISNSPWKRHSYRKPVGFSNFLAQASVPNCMNSGCPEFQFKANVFVSVATRLSDLDEQKPGTNIQKEGHTHTPPSSWNGPEDTEAFGSTPSQSPSQSQVRKPNHHEAQYCLEIQVISAKDERTAPPPSHARQVPVVEDMVQDGKAGLTEAAVTGPDQAILFYGWWSLGEGLSSGKVWDTVFTLSGAISWVRLPGRAGKEFRDRHHIGWCTYHIGWIL